MNSATWTDLQWILLRTLCASIVLLAATTAPAEVIFRETFDGYRTNTNFPNQSNDIGGHRTIYGVPNQAAGADSDLWLAGRFEMADSDPIANDVGVLRFASGPVGGPHYNPAGRVDDDGGLVVRLDLTRYQHVTLSFKWRTFATESNDRFVVAYYRGDDLGAPWRRVRLVQRPDLRKRRYVGLRPDRRGQHLVSEQLDRGAPRHQPERVSTTPRDQHSRRRRDLHRLLARQRRPRPGEIRQHRRQRQTRPGARAFRSGVGGHRHAWSRPVCAAPASALVSLRSMPLAHFFSLRNAAQGLNDAASAC